MVKKTKTEILREDRMDYSKLLFLKKHSKINVLCSFTYITPNYDVIATLNELYNFVKDKDSRVFLIMWDMNSLANPYFKKYCSHKVKDKDSFIEQKMQEVRGIANAIGFDDKNLLVYRSSDLWRRLVSFREENLFQQFFSVLARLPVKDFQGFRKCSHIFQISLDIFFSNFLNRLYPEDGDEEIDIIFSDFYKKNLYMATRKIMEDEGIIKNKPLFLLMETVPYIVYDERVPEWNMKLEEIKYILMNASNNLQEMIQVLNYINEDVSSFELSSKDSVIEILAKELFNYLSKYKKLYIEKNGQTEEVIVNITKQFEALKLGHILRSKLFLDILNLSDGSRNTSEIAKQLKKSVATISSYTGELKNLGYVCIDSEGKLKKKLQGAKINFEFGL